MSNQSVFAIDNYPQGFPVKVSSGDSKEKKLFINSTEVFHYKKYKFEH